MTELLELLPHIVLCIVVCLAKIIEISIQSLKTVMMVKGERLKAALLGFIECLIWGLVIASMIASGKIQRLGGKKTGGYYCTK